MNADINEVIDKNLRIINESNERQFMITNFIDGNGRKLGLRIHAEKFASIMESKGLITVNGDFASVEDLGYNIYKNGGWLKRVMNSKIESENEIEKANKRETIEIANLEYSIAVNKWLLKTKWWPHLISIISLLASIYFGINSIKYESESTKLLKRLEIIESKLKEGTTDAKLLLLNSKESIIESTTEKKD